MAEKLESREAMNPESWEDGRPGVFEAGRIESWEAMSL
jgi:hypothetical protein